MPLLQSRLEAGRAEAGLPELESQLFSNEDQMLQQAAIWQQQAAARAAEQRAAAAAAPAAEMEAQWQQEDWAASAAGIGGAAAGSGSGAVDGLALLAAELEQLGMAAHEAAQLVQWASRSLPASPQLWDAAQQQQAVAWLQQRLNLQLTAHELAELAPRLLADTAGSEEQQLGAALTSGSSSSAGGSSSDGDSSSPAAQVRDVLAQLVQSALQAAPADQAAAAGGSGG